MNFNFISNCFLYISNNEYNYKFNQQSHYLHKYKTNHFNINNNLNLNSNLKLNEILNNFDNNLLKQHTSKYNDILSYKSKMCPIDNPLNNNIVEDNINSICINKSLINTVNNVLNNIGFQELNEYQKCLFDELSKGMDVIIHTETSSGKTFAVLLYMVMNYYYNINPQLLTSNSLTHLFKDLNNDNKSSDINEYNIKNNSNKSRVLILSPTKELALQSAKQILNFTNNNKKLVQLIIDEDSNLSEISDDVMFIVGSSNQVERLLLNNDIKDSMSILQSIEYVFLDEVDRLIKVANQYASQQKKEKLYKNPGSAYNICQSILNFSPQKVRFVCASASITRRHIIRIDKLFQKYRKVRSKNTAIIRNKFDRTDTGRYVSIPDTVKHYYWYSKDDTIESKVNRLVELLKNDTTKPIIFVSNGSLISIKNQLRNNKIECNILHHELGIKDDAFDDYLKTKDYIEDDIYKRIENFQNKINDENDKTILIASNDSARGIHIPLLETVYILGKPRNANEYIHISGRVGRCSRNGRCVTIDSKENIRILKSWQKHLNIIIKDVDDTQNVAFN